MKRLIAASAIALACQGISMAEMNSPQAARHVLSLNDVDITALIDDVSIITGNTFILHPDVRRTKVTVMSQAPMTTNEVFQVVSVQEVSSDIRSESKACTTIT